MHIVVAYMQLARMEGSAAGGAVAALCCSDQQRPHVLTLLAPLRQVDYREKLYAVGRIPSTYNKREGTAKEHELLAVRAAGGARQWVGAMAHVAWGVQRADASAYHRLLVLFLEQCASACTMPAGAPHWARPAAALPPRLCTGQRGETWAAEHLKETSSSGAAGAALTLFVCQAACPACAQQGCDVKR